MLHYLLSTKYTWGYKAVERMYEYGIKYNQIMESCFSYYIYLNMNTVDSDAKAKDYVAYYNVMCLKSLVTVLTVSF